MSFWAGRRVLVTGSSGFVGSWLSMALSQAGARVLGLDRRPRPAGVLAEAAHHSFVLGDVADYQSVERVVGSSDIQCLFHLAAEAQVGEASKTPWSSFESNVRGTWNLLEACRRKETLQAIVVATSDKAYGIQDRLPYLESAALRGGAPYDASKACADLISQSYARTYGLPVSTIRWGNIFGGGDLSFSRLIPYSIREYHFDRAPKLRSDGTHVRNYLHVTDAVRGYLALAEAIATDGVKGEAFNMAGDRRFQVVEIVALIQRLMNKTALSPVIINDCKHEIPLQFLSIEKARTRLSWTPRVDLESGLRSTVDWYSQYLSRNGT